MTEAAPTPPAAAPAQVAADPQRTNWALVALLRLSGVAAAARQATAAGRIG